MSAELARHAASLARCRRCPAVAGTPIVVVPESPARVLLIGQAPGPREQDRRRLFAHTAGTKLFSWIARLEVAEEAFRSRVWMAASIRCFPGRDGKGGDRAPAPDEIERCRPHLDHELEILRPTTVIAIGKHAQELFLPPAPLTERVGRSFEIVHQGHDFELVPLPHPSGRSTWLARPEHAALLDRALSRLAASPGWREAFPDSRRRPRRETKPLG